MAVNNFKKTGYQIVKKAIPKNLATFVYNYFLIKKQVFDTLTEKKYISPYTEDWGTYNDDQTPNSYSHYSDIAMETLLLLVQPIVEKHTELKLTPTYSYARLYKNGDVLEKHKDRFSCEISCTMNLGANTTWPIYLKPSGKKEVPVIQQPGDLLIYKGAHLEHWRNAYTGKDYCQVFLHYNNVKTKGGAENIFDTRLHPGLPQNFREKK